MKLIFLSFLNNSVSSTSETIYLLLAVVSQGHASLLEPYKGYKTSLYPSCIFSCFVGLLAKEDKGVIQICLSSTNE